MALQSIDGKVNDDDKRINLGMGTVGGDHMATLTPRTLNTIISVFDQRVSYAPSGAWTANINSAAHDLDFLGENVQNLTTSGVNGATITLNFTGTQIGIIGQNNTGSGLATIAIDGVLTPGRVNTYTQLAASYGLSSNGLNATDTTINVVDTSNFSSSGSILIDSEVINYTGTTGTAFTGCKRGAAGGGPAITHTTGVTVYGWTSTINTNISAGTQDRILLWGNSMLTPGNHTLTLTKTAGTAGSIYINGFTVGGLIGAANIHTYVDYVTIGSMPVTTNGTTPLAYSNSAWALNPSRSDAQVLSVLGASVNTTGGGFATYDPQQHKWWFIFPNVGTQTLSNVVVAILVLGPGF